MNYTGKWESYGRVEIIQGYESYMIRNHTGVEVMWGEIDTPWEIGLRMPKIAKNCHKLPKCCPTFMSIHQTSPVELIQLLIKKNNIKMDKMSQRIYSQRCEF